MDIELANEIIRELKNCETDLSSAMIYTEEAYIRQRLRTRLDRVRAIKRKLMMEVRQREKNYGC